ncbi:MAG: hypothetical protein IJS08_16415 [Victivallales bacterium]|nr:hypothetical protein [Victivallales bacterium]
MNPMDLFCNALFKAPPLHQYCRSILWKVWSGCTPDDRRIFASNAGVSIDDQVSLHNALFDAFIGFMGEMAAKWTVKDAPKLARLASIDEESRLRLEKELLSNYVREFFCKVFKEESRADGNTFSHLYRRVQCFARDYRKERLYGTGANRSRYYAGAGLSDEAFSEARAHSASRHDPRFEEIPLPPVPPLKQEFYEDYGEGARFRSEPFLALLDHFASEAEHRGLGPVIELRTFCEWLNDHYAFVETEQRLNGSTDNSGEDQLSLDLPSDELEQEVMRICKDGAARLFTMMTPEQRRLCRIFFDYDSWQERAELLDIPDANKARNEVIRFLRNFLYPQVLAMPALDSITRTSEQAWQLFKQTLYDMCKEPSMRP